MREHAQKHAMKVEVVERVRQHLPGRVCTDAAAVQIAPADQQMYLRPTMDSIDPREADETNGLRLVIDENRAPNIRAAPAQIVVEPRLVDIFGDVSRRCTEPVDEIAILPPSIDDWNIL